MWNARLNEAQAGIKISRRSISNLRYSDDTTLMAEREELKILLMKVKEESEKFGLKFNTQQTKIMASGPITSWQIDGETMERVTDFINYFLGGVPKSLQMVTIAMELKDVCSLEVSYDQPTQHIKKQRHYQQNLSCQSYCFSSSHVWMWELDDNESWVLKNLKNRCFWTAVLEKTLESPLDCKRIQSVTILKDISPE